MNYGFGLAVKGSSHLSQQPYDLTIFNILFWLLNTTCILIGFLGMPGAQVIIYFHEIKLNSVAQMTGDFPGNILMGQICMGEEIASQSTEEIITGDRLKGFIFPVIFSVFILFFSLKVRGYVRSQCLSRTTFRFVLQKQEMRNIF